MSSGQKEKRADAQIVMNAIRRIVRSLRQSSKQSEKRLGLGAAQIFVLHKVAESPAPLSINDLAARTLTHQSSVSVVASKLARRGFLERVPSERDSRQVLLKLSRSGRNLLGRSSPLIQERLVGAVNAMDTKTRQGLIRGLEALIENAGLGQEEPALFFEDKKGVQQ